MASRRCWSVPVEMICQTAFITWPISGFSAAKSPPPSGRSGAAKGSQTPASSSAFAAT
jgi:hypothetical protein